MARLQHTSHAFLLAAGFVVVGCTPQPEEGRDSSASSHEVAKPVTAESTLSVGAPVSYANLTIFPIISSVPRNDDRFITLDEGLLAGTIEIREVGSAGDDGRGQVSQRQLANQERLPLGASDDLFGAPAEPAAEESSESDDLFGAPPVDEEPNTADASDDLFDAPADERPTTSDDLFGPPAEPFMESQASDAVDLFGAPPEEEPDAPEAGDDLFGPAETDQQEINSEDDNPFGAGEPFGEMGRSNDVNQLLVINNSGKPLYLMPGEVIVGGSQDRTIGRETIVQSDGKPVDVGVFCVEHGRWGDRDASEFAGTLAASAEQPAVLSLVVSQTVPADEIAVEANSGKFVASAGALSKEVRRVVHAQAGQSEVWDKVAKVNATMGNENATGRFTENYLDKKTNADLKQYLTALNEQISETENVVGVVVAIDGEIQSADAFESTPLFRKLWPKLLKSYALDACQTSEDANEQTTPTVEAAQQFLAEAEVDSVAGSTRRRSPNRTTLFGGG